MKKRKWLIYTVLIGLMPLLIRLFIFLTTKNTQTNYILNEVDIVTFGLVLNLTNINELEDNEKVDKKWKTTNIGFSVLLLILFSLFLGIAYIADFPNNTQFDKSNIRNCAALLGVVSFFMSYSIYNRLNTI